MTRYVNLLRLLMLLKPLARVKENAFIAEAIVLMITSAWQTPLLLFLMCPRRLPRHYHPQGFHWWCGCEHLMGNAVLVLLGHHS